MTPRFIAVRLVLVVAALATVATSARQDHELSDVADRTLGPGASRIALVANRAAVNHAYRVSLVLELTTPAGAMPTTVTIIPDDPSSPASSVAVGQTVTQTELDLTGLCMRDRDCNAGVTVEVPAGGAVDVIATGTLFARADSSFFLPDDRSFPDTATVEVGFQP